MRDFTLGELKIDVTQPPDRLVLRWRGACREQNPGLFLTPFFDSALTLAIDKKLQLELHFESLSYFNSSTVGVLLRFIEATVKRKVKMKLIYDKAQRWQGHNFEAIAALNRLSGLVEVEGV